MMRPDLTGRPVALFVFSNLRDQKFGLTKAWLRRLRLFDAAGWDTHVATIHFQPEIDQTLASWVERGMFPASTQVHHFQRRNKRFRPEWNRRTDDTFSRDDRIADWLDWLVGRIPGAVVFADSPVTYAPIAKMRNPHVGKVMTLHLGHRTGSTPAQPARSVAPSQVAPAAVPAAPSAAGSRGGRAPIRRYGSLNGQPKLTGRFLPFAHAADVVVALTQGHAEHLRQDLPGVDVRVIPNIVDRPDVAPDVERDPLRIVYAGRLEKIKRVDHAIEAVGRAAARVPGLHMDIFGRGRDLDRLVQLRDSLGLAGVVEFRGFTTTPELELAASALSTMTARREPFGLAVAESLAVGTPVVTYDVEYGPSELVTDQVDGRVVPDGSVDALAGAIVDVLADRHAWQRMSRAAPRAIARLDPAVVGRQWLDLAAEVASRVPLPACELLVEDLWVRREGLVVSGVALGTQPDGLPARVIVPARPRAELGLDVAGTPSHPGTVAADARAVIPATAVALWAADGALRAVSGGGAEVHVRAPGAPRVVVPAVAGPVAVGPLDGEAIVRLPLEVPVRVEARPGQFTASFGEDVTVLTDALRLRGRLVDAEGGAPRIEVDILDPQIAFAEGSSLGVVARSGDRAVTAGLALVEPGAGTWADHCWTGTAGIVWDAEALAEASAWLRTPAVLSLGSGRSARSLGPLDFAARSPVPVTAGGRWLLAPASTGRLMLVPGAGLRVRLTSAVRNVRRNRPSV